MISAKWLFAGLALFLFGWLWYRRKPAESAAPTAAPTPINVYVDLGQPTPTAGTAATPVQTAPLPSAPVVEIAAPAPNAAGSSLTMAGWAAGEFSDAAVAAFGPDSITRYNGYVYRPDREEPVAIGRGGGWSGFTPLYDAWSNLRAAGADTYLVRAQIAWVYHNG